MLVDGLESHRLLWCFYQSHSDGTHSLQGIHWWASDVMLHFPISVLMKKLINLHLGWPMGEYTFSNFFIFWWIIPSISPSECLLRYSKVVLIYNCIYLGREKEHYKRCTKHFQPAQNLLMPMHEQYLKDILHDIYRFTTTNIQMHKWRLQIYKACRWMKTLNLHKLIKQLNMTH